MNKTWKIYVHRNLTNGKLYIGQTCEDNVKRRWHGGANYRKCPYFYNAIQKYGWDGFDHFVIIDDIKTQEEANVLEEFLIAKYDTTNREKGYNLQSGGDVKKQSPETCLKISQHHIEAHQRRPQSSRLSRRFSPRPSSPCVSPHRRVLCSVRDRRRESRQRASSSRSASTPPRSSGCQATV